METASTMPRRAGRASAGSSRLAAAYLSGVEAKDPAAGLLAAVTVLASAFLAAYLPAKRASRLDPMATLRQE